MNSHKEKPPADFEVDDPAAAFRKLEDATRKLLHTPKKEADAAMAKDKAGKKTRKH